MPHIGRRQVVDLDIARRLAFRSPACGAAGFLICHGGSCRGHRCGGDRDRGSASSQQGCNVGMRILITGSP